MLQKSRKLNPQPVYFINIPTQTGDKQDSTDISFHIFKNPVKENTSSDKAGNVAGTSKKKINVIVKNTSDFPVIHQAANKHKKSVLEQYGDSTSLAKNLPQNTGSKQDQIALGKHSDPEMVFNVFGNTQDNLTFEKYRDPSSPPKNDGIKNVKVSDSSIFSPEISNTLDYRSGKSIASDDSLSNSDSVNVLVDEDSNIENESNSGSHSMRGVLDMGFDIVDKTKEKESMDVDCFSSVADGTENDKKKNQNDKSTQTEHFQTALIHNYAVMNDCKSDYEKAPHAESFALPADHDYIHTARAPGDEDDSTDEDNVDGNDVADVCRHVLRSCINKVGRDLQNPFYRTAASGGLFRIAPTASVHWSSGGLNAAESSPWMPHQSEIKASHSKVSNVAEQNPKEIEDDKNMPDDAVEDTRDEVSFSYGSFLGYYFVTSDVMLVFNFFHILYCIFNTIYEKVQLSYTAVFF